METADIIGDWLGYVIDGRFTLLKRLGGSQGVDVFLAEFGDPAQKATIKFIPVDTRDVEIRIAAWQAAENLYHPNLIQVLANGRCEIDSVTFLYVVSEFADEVLAEIIPERALEPKEAQEMLEPALDALTYLHGKGFVHGRVKPSNIMAVGEHLKLSADGLIFAGAMTEPRLERTVYDAPETAQGSIGTAADIWSLGATLVEALTQHPPLWDGRSTLEPAVPLSVPEPFAAVAHECLRNNPARRCTLEMIKARLSGETTAPPVEEETGKSATTKRRIAVLIGAVAALLAALAIWQAQTRHEESSSPAATEQNSQVAPAAPTASAPVSAPSPAPAPESAPAPATPAASAPPAAAAASPAQAPSTAPAPVAAAPSTPAAAPPQSQSAAKQPSGSVTAKGAVAQQVEPDILPSALRTISGTVKASVRVDVDAAGNVTDSGFESAGPSKYFANKALDAARSWKFTPAQVNGQAVASSWILHFDFKQSGVSVDPVETAP